MTQILVVHNLSKLQRQTTIEFALSFGRYAPADTEVTHHHIRRPINDALRHRRFDAVFISYEVLSLRASPQWEWTMEQLLELRELADMVVAFPQDDYTYNKVLDDGLAALGTDVIYTPIETGLDLVYPKMSKRARLGHALTGYVDERTATAHSSLAPMADRTINIGQRVRLLPPWFGISAREKGIFAERFVERANEAGYPVDISTREEDAFRNYGWYEFLSRCRATIGQKGGASLCDPDGSIMEAVVSYTELHPAAEFNEIEAACFPGLDGRAEMRAVSPRLFDAAMLGTVQILVEDDYLGEFEPWTHYIPTDLDITNFDEITEALADTHRLETIAHAARLALIDSGRYTYRAFVERILEETVGRASPLSPKPQPAASPVEPLDQLQWRLTEGLFEAVQRISYLAWVTEALPDLERLVRSVAELLDQHPALSTHLDTEFLTSLAGASLPLTHALETIRGPLVDTAVECARLGAISALADHIAQLQSSPPEEWQLHPWAGRDRLELDAAIDQ